jgi:poly(beta-D-mannuronate) lyase
VLLDGPTCTTVSLGAQVHVSAKTPGMTIFTGLTRFVLDGDWITLSGFVFTDGGPENKEGAVKFDNGSRNCRLTNCSFRDFNQGLQHCA